MAYYGETIDDLLQYAEDKMNMYISSADNLKKILDKGSALPDFNFITLAMIDGKRDNVSFLGTFDYWNEQGFKVKYKERGLRVVDKLNDKPSRFIDSEGNIKDLALASADELALIELGELNLVENKSGVVFKKNYLFDISQTSAPPEFLEQHKKETLILGDLAEIRDFVKSAVPDDYSESFAVTESLTYLLCKDNGISTDDIRLNDIPFLFIKGEGLANNWLNNVDKIYHSEIFKNKVLEYSIDRLKKDKANTETDKTETDEQNISAADKEVFIQDTLDIASDVTSEIKSDKLNTDSTLNQNGKIEDFGKKIGGARKDIWRSRGLLYDDVLDWNEGEKDKYITKDNVWPKPDYQKMVDDGMPVRVAYFINTLRNSLPAKPVFTYSKDKNAVREEFIDFIVDMKEAASELTKEQECIDFGKRVFDILNKYSFLNYRQIRKINNAAVIRGFNNIDRKIAKKQFCYTDDMKLYDGFSINKLDGKECYIEKDPYSEESWYIVHQFSGGKEYKYPHPFDKNSSLKDKNTWKDNTYFIVYKYAILDFNFDTLEDAKVRLKEIATVYNEARQSTKTNKKKSFIPEPLKGVDRVGPDNFEGKVITGEDILNDFGIRGGEFGNWLNDKDRQAHLNFCYDAFCDLAAALGVDKRDIAFDNQLSIAFGARGRSRAVAHYEPLRQVINLTKMKGAGSLAHEFGHAFDHIISSNIGGTGFLSERNIKHNVVVENQELIDAYKELDMAIKVKKCSPEEFEAVVNEKRDKRIKYSVDGYRGWVMCNFPDSKMDKSSIEYRDSLIQKAIDICEKHSDDKEMDACCFDELNNISIELCNLRKSLFGHVIKKDNMKQLELWGVEMYKAHLFSNPMYSQFQYKDSEYYLNSKKFDGIYAKEDKGYWSSDVELFARAFACYIHDKLELIGIKNDYLCGHCDSCNALFPDSEGNIEVIKAYPVGEERAAINKCFDKIVDIVREKNLMLAPKTKGLSI